MRIYRAIYIISIFSCLLLSGCRSSQAADYGSLTISAAASLKEPLEKIVQQYEKVEQVDINLNFGASGSLQKQIEEGAPVDLFISAGKSQADALIRQGLADKDTCSELLTNSLVLIVSDAYAKGINSIDALKDKDIRIALGETATVPVGQYSKEFLESKHLWENFENKAVYAKDVRAVLNYVEMGEAETGIVYRSDAVNLKNSYIAYEIPADSHSPIVYPAVIIAQSKNKVLAKDFIEFMKDSAAREIFKDYSFNVRDN